MKSDINKSPRKEAPQAKSDSQREMTPEKMNARLSAFRVLSRVERDGAYSNLALLGEQAKYPDAEEADRRLLTELVYGVLRNYRFLDSRIEAFSTRNLKKIDPSVKRVLRLALYQLEKLDRIPEHAALAEAGKLLRKLGKKHAVGFANALLRNYLRAKKKEQLPKLSENTRNALAMKHSIPDWMAKRIAEKIDNTEETEKRRHFTLDAHLESLNKPSPLTLAVNPQKTTVAELIELIRQAGGEAERGLWVERAVVVTKGGFGVVLPFLEAGLCHVMDEASQLVAELVDAKEGETILDLCAAPGGKSLYLAGNVGDGGRIVSVDIHDGKLGLLAEQAKKAGFGNIETIVADARKPIKRLEDLRFDAILLDAPCTALGLLRRHPEIRQRRDEADILRLSSLARDIAFQALNYFTKGGRLIYSVCTDTKEEGEAQLKLLAIQAGITCDSLSTLYPKIRRMDEHCAWMDTSGQPTLDGFFAAKLLKLG